MKFPSTIIQCPCCGAPCEPLESTSHIVIEEERICDECEYEFVINSLGTIIDDGGIDRTSPYRISDDGELTLDEEPVHCPHCARMLDVSSAGELDVVRCSFCQRRTHFLWSELRQIVVPEFRGKSPDWYDPNTPDEIEELDFDEEYEEWGCVNGCQDPIFGGPTDDVLVNGRWICPICEIESGGEF